MYQATQLKVLERVDKALDNRSHVLMRPLLDATKDVRDQKKAKLESEHKIDFDEIDLKECVKCSKENVVGMSIHSSDDESEHEETSSNNEMIATSGMFTSDIFENISSGNSSSSESDDNNSQD